MQNGLFINGKWLHGNSTLNVNNPATGEIISSVAMASSKDTEQAIAVAEEAFQSWRSTTAKQRSLLLKQWFNLIIENRDDLAKILTAEQGKILAEAKGEIIYGANYIEWFAEEAKRVYGDTIPQTSNDKRLICIKQPVGVVACITPWNFPSAMLTRKIAPALAAGCTVVCKTASETPLSALALAELSKRAGIPDGVINMLVGKASEIGPVLTGSPVVRKLSFTGSTTVGKILLEQCAGTVKKVSMELGGNAPFIVFDDADLDAAVDGLMASKYRNSGQTCVCTNRVFVQKSIYKEFSEKVVAAVENRLSMGDGFSEGVTTGPLINKEAVSSIRDLVERSVSKGASILTGGTFTDLGENYFQPTILGDVTNDMPIAREEIFGPVAPLIVFDDEQEVIEMANNTNVGLSAYFYSRDIGRVWRVSEQLEYGMVGINEGILSNEAAPFGGVKESGMGREGSKYGLDDYLEIKYICIGGLDA
ncbi:MAG: NAD-dependent succinate-semialdehyde dehydrogenase [Gammaproteobacteria bacterium]|nr:NAD-dependent succinate-semialdehyde dehydrogenase [Gammaproteobacteria bacterium]